MSNKQSTVSPLAFRSRSKCNGRLSTLAFSTLALLSVSVVQAQTNSSGNSYSGTIAPGASYIALNAGTSDLSRPVGSFSLFGGQQQGQAYGVAIGNYVTGQNYGYEVGYADFGSVTRYGGSTKVDGIVLNMLGRLPVGANINLLGKVGTTYSRTNVSTDTANSSLAGSQNGFDWSYGLGVELMLTPQWGATLQYAEHFVSYPATGSERISSTTLGARFYF